MNRLLDILARLPLSALYGFSSLGAFVLRHIWHYRCDVIDKNLRNSFPKLNDRERKAIKNEFYGHFCDSFAETLKLLHMSDAEMSQRMHFEGLDIMQRYIEQGRDIVIYFSHMIGWEWAPSVTLHLRDNGRMVFGQIYRPLRDKAFDALMLKLRSRFHSESIAKQTALLRLMRIRRDGGQWAVGFMSDQHPSHGDSGIDLTFLNQPTKMISGTEHLARKLNAAVIYWDMRPQPSRGHYCITVRDITHDPKSMPQGEITKIYAQMLQTTIRRNPAWWLWSHNRWK